MFATNFRTLGDDNSENVTTNGYLAIARGVAEYDSIGLINSGNGN